LGRAPRIGAVAGAVLAFSGVAASAARPAERIGRVAALPALAAPVQPREHRLPFGSLRLSQSTIVAGAQDQDIEVTVNPDRAPPSGAVRVHLYRPALPSSARNGRGITRFDLASRTIDLEGKAARTVTFSDLNPPPGRYRLDLLDPRTGRLIERAPFLVYAQSRLPPRVYAESASASPGAVATAASSEADVQRSTGARALPSAAINNNLTNNAGDEAETYTAVEPDNAARVIAGVNPSSTNPQAWISNASMKPGAITVSTLPTTTALPTSEGGGTVSPGLCCDPTFAADDRGNFWYGVLTLGPSQSCGTPTLCHVIVNRVAGPSGTSFQVQNTAIPRATAGLQDKPMITIDSWASSPKRYRLYAVWIENPGQNVVVSQCDASTATNCDNPDNWSVPVHITSVGATYTYPSVAAAPNGDVYVTWWDQTNDDIRIDRCLAAENCALAASWNEDSTIDNDLVPGSASALPFFCPIISAPGGRVGALTYVDVGPDGRVYVAWSELRNNGTTICNKSPTDRTFDSYIAAGAANTIPALNSGVRLSDDSVSDTNDHFFASLAADPSLNNTVESSFYSTIDDPTRQTTQQCYVSSTNGGASYSAMQQITTAPSDFSGANSNGFDYGDYEGADAAGGVFYPVWSDNRASAGGDAELFMLTPTDGSPDPVPGLCSSPTPPGGGGGGGDTTAPNTTIEKGPKKKTHSHKAKFKFSSNEPGSSFQCKLDRKPFKSCTSPKKYANLKPGRHKFQVRGIDAAGNTDSTPATRKWKVLAS